MRRWLLLRSPCSILILSTLAAACATASVERPSVARRRPVEIVREPPPEAVAGLYAADEALQDALSGQWEYLGTGPWPGIDRTRACVFRNERVLVVNVYCTVTETQAFRIDIYSPERGRVRIYAEASGPVSARERSEYFTFTAESEPPPGPETGAPPLALAMTFGDLHHYDERRYDAFLPMCYGGEQLSRKQNGCLGTLAARTGEWLDRNRAFLEHANADWYRIVREMRSLAARYGLDPR
jgi:hypothetical protein